MFPSGETNGTTGQAGEFEPDMKTGPGHRPEGRNWVVRRRCLNILLDFHTGGM